MTCPKHTTGAGPCYCRDSVCARDPQFEVSYDKGLTWAPRSDILVRGALRAVHGTEQMIELVNEMLVHGLEATMPSGAIYRVQREEAKAA